MNPRVITLQWGDGEYPFAINIGQARELEALQKIGIGAIYQRMVAGLWHIDDAYHVIRLGLIGGGMVPTEALRLCQVYVLDRPFAEAQQFAIAVLLACLYGADEKKALVSESEAAAPLTE